MSTLTLDQASTIVDATLRKGRDTGCRPLTVVVLDAGGHAVALKREDGSGILRPAVAAGKAWGALGLGVSSRTLAGMAAERPTFVSALAVAAEGRIVPAPGGVLVRDREGALLGAVGVTGDTSDKDEACAIAGIEAAGLTPEV